MSKLNHKSIVFGLGLLAMLVFSAITLPVKAQAQYNDGSSYNTNPIPFLYSISPGVANVGEGSKTVTISGSGFVPSSVARWNGSSRPTTFIDSRHLLIQLNASDLQGSNGRYINVYNAGPGGGYSQAEFFTLNGYSSAPAPVDPNAHLYSDNSNGNTQNNSGFFNTTDTNSNTTENNGTSLASNAIFGSNSLLPSGLIQWTLVAIIILLLVIFARKFFGATDRYHKSPLKHA